MNWGVLGINLSTHKIKKSLAGIYIHIPFCKKACHYCDFHFSTNLSNMGEMTKAILTECTLRQEYLEGEPVNSIYLGGGTPSLMPPSQLNEIIVGIRDTFEVMPNAEVTLEMNPDDLNKAHLDHYREMGINRVSLGIQTFDDKVLKYLNRAHTSNQARKALDMLRECGFDNISADLIYGIPIADQATLRNDLSILIKEQLPHISTYCLTVEPGTVFGHLKTKGKLVEKDDGQQADEYELIAEQLTEAGLLHYEVSNFGRIGQLALHNSSYWKHQGYLGLGPGAHSYNGNSRQFNIRNNAIYLKKLSQGNIPAEIEILSHADKVNETILTGLRTMWGIDLGRLKAEFDHDLEKVNGKEVEQMRAHGYLLDGGMILTTKGKLLADGLASQLFI